MINIVVGGWATPLKNMKVKWDDDIPNIWKKNVPNHQPDPQVGCGTNIYFFRELLFLLLQSPMSVHFPTQCQKEIPKILLPIPISLWEKSHNSPLYPCMFHSIILNPLNLS